MTAADVIAPVARPSAGRTNARPDVLPLARQPSPLPDLPPQRTSTVVYGASAVDDRGRVADRVVLRALSWPAGHRLDNQESAGTLTAVPDPTGNHHVTSQGYLRTPAEMRHRCGLAAGDRVLLAADPDRSHLAIYPPAALDRALDQHHPNRPGGEPE
jgi:hypothetical protein